MRLLKMDVYRMRKSRYSYIIFAVLMVFLALECVAIFAMNASDTAGMPPVVLISVMECAQFMIRADVIVMFVMFFAVTFVGTEFSSGFIKNIYSKEAHKFKLFLSKIGTVAIYTALIFISVLILGLLGELLFGYEFVLGDRGMEFTRFVLVQYLLHVAFGTVVLCIATIFRSSAAPMIAGILYITLGRWIYLLIDKKVQDILGLTDFNLSDYVVYGNLALIDTNSSAGACVRACVVSVAVIAVSVILGHLVLKKRDVR